MYLWLLMAESHHLVWMQKASMSGALLLTCIFSCIYVWNKFYFSFFFVLSQFLLFIVVVAAVAVFGHVILLYKTLIYASCVLQVFRIYNIYFIIFVILHLLIGVSYIVRCLLHSYVAGGYVPQHFQSDRKFYSIMWFLFFRFVLLFWTPETFLILSTHLIPKYFLFSLFFCLLNLTPKYLSEKWWRIDICISASVSFLFVWPTPKFHFQLLITFTLIM